MIRKDSAGPNSFLPAVVTEIYRRIGAGNSSNSGDRSGMLAVRSLWSLCRVLFDVGEKEGNGAGGKIGHGQAPKVLAWRNLGWIVAWSIIRDEAQRVLDCSWTEDR
jgi:hypothetical protein